MSTKVTMPEDNENPEQEPNEDDMIDAILAVPDEDLDEDEILESDEDDDEDEDEDLSVSIDELSDDTELWPGGPLIGQIKEWKAQYGENSVYVTSITFDEHVVWRTINRGEYKAHVRNMEKLMQSNELSQADATLYGEEAIAELCILYPEYNRRTAGKEMAGIPAIISQEVMEASGFVALEVRKL